MFHWLMLALHLLSLSFYQKSKQAFIFMALALLLPRLFETGYGVPDKFKRDVIIFGQLETSPSLGLIC